jgi:hypothetical protein
MVGSLPACCARAVSGRPIAAPPARRVMNSRRFTRAPASTMTRADYQMISQAALLNFRALSNQRGFDLCPLLRGRLLNSGTCSRRSAALMVPGNSLQQCRVQHDPDPYGVTEKTRFGPLPSPCRSESCRHYIKDVPLNRYRGNASCQCQ